MPTLPKDKLMQHGPELPMAKRLRRYQHDIRTIRTLGCAVPSSAYADALDPAAFKMWFHDSAEQRHRLKATVQALVALPPDRDADWGVGRCGKAVAR